MNKKRVNEWLLPAKKALKTTGIVTVNKDTGKEEIDKTYRSQVSSFGAAVIMGSLPATVAFFSEQGGSTVKREKLIEAMYICIKGEETAKEMNVKKILDFVCENNSLSLREEFTDASIALKLAMNFFELV